MLLIIFKFINMHFAGERSSSRSCLKNCSDMSLWEKSWFVGEEGIRSLRHIFEIRSLVDSFLPGRTHSWPKSTDATMANKLPSWVFRQLELSLPSTLPSFQLKLLITFSKHKETVSQAGDLEETEKIIFLKLVFIICLRIHFQNETLY